MGASASAELQLQEEQLALERQQDATREAQRVAQRQASPSAGRSTRAEGIAYEKMGKRAKHQIDGGGHRTEEDAGFTVIVRGAKGLRDADWWGNSDPYCDVRLGAAGSSWERKGRGGKTVTLITGLPADTGAAVAAAQRQSNAVHTTSIALFIGDREALSSGSGASTSAWGTPHLLTW